MLENEVMTSDWEDPSYYRQAGLPVMSRFFSMMYDLFQTEGGTWVKASLDGDDKRYYEHPEVFWMLV